MSDKPSSTHIEEPEAGPQFEPYESPAGGWGALQATARALREQSIVMKGSRALLSMNQPAGFGALVAHGPTPNTPARSNSARTVRRPFPPS